MTVSEAKIMTSPVGTPLKLVLRKAKECIEKLGVTTYETVGTFRQLADHLVVEDNSDVLSEEFKKQRDVDPLRVKNLKTYWAESEGPVFPGMTIFANELDIIQEVTVSDCLMVVANIPATADRFICDGQGRTSFIKWLVELAGSEQYWDHTIAFKLIVTHTPTLSHPKAVRIIKQVFADYHVRLVKPNRSVSQHFDTGTHFARFLNELLDIDVGGEFKKRIALHGKIKRHHVWTYQQFASMIQKFLKVTPGSANKELADESAYKQSLELCKQFIGRLCSVLPFSVLDADNYAEVHEQAVFTKAVFANALAYVGRSIVDEMVLNDGMTWEVLTSLPMPLLNKLDKYWLKSKVTMDDDGSLKIIKGTERRIGALICRELRVFPCQELSA